MRWRPEIPRWWYKLVIFVEICALGSLVGLVIYFIIKYW